MTDLLVCTDLQSKKRDAHICHQASVTDVAVCMCASAQEVVLSKQSRAREEAEKKVGKLIKQQDHMECARRQEEAPLLEAAHSKRVWGAAVSDWTILLFRMIKSQCTACHLCCVCWCDASGCSGRARACISIVIAVCSSGHLPCLMIKA